MIYSELFVGRPGVYAVAYARGKGYKPVKRKITPAVIGKHIQGDITAGLYLIRPKDNSVRLMAFDVDKDDEALAKSIAQAAVIEVPDTSILIERTGGRGWHIWIFVDDWIEAREARAFMRAVLEKVNLTYPVELYPKQDRIRAEGLGNLMRLPLGKHQRTGKEGQLYNAFMLPFDVEDGNDPDMPLEPAPASLVRGIAQSKIDQEKISSPAIDDGGGPTTLPCISQFQKGVGEGFRDEAMFRLAAYLHRQQIPKDAAWVVLEKANERSKPPISRTDLNSKLTSAYSGAGYGLPCSSDLVGLDSQFCDPACPVYSTAKRRSPAGDGVQIGGAARFPRIIERGGVYIFQRRTKTGIQEQVISNFTMDVMSRLEMPGEGSDVLRVRIIATGGREDIIDIPVSAFASKAMFLRLLVRAEYAWYGGDHHCQYLKSYLTDGEMETQQAITRLGRAKTEEGDVWVQRNGIITMNGMEQEGSAFTYHRPEHFGIVSAKVVTKSFTLSKTKTVLKSLMNLNTLSVMVPTIGWAFSVPFKPWFMERLGHFPLLMLYGTRGAGKTQMVQRSVMPLFGYDSREPQIFFCDTTRFVMVSYGASTTTVPLFFDEYRPNALPGTKLRMLWDHWRHLYAEDTDHRGQADLSRLSFKQTAPVIVAGEEMVLDPAMQERMIQVGMSPDFLTHERQKAFRGQPPLEMASYEFIKFCLSTDPDPLMAKARSRIAGQWERQVSPRIYDNLLVVAFGLEVWAKLTGRTVTKKMINHIFDLTYMVRDTEGEVRTPLWVDDFLLDVAGIIEEKGPFTWGIVEREGDRSLMHINLRRAHAEWAKDMRSRGDQAVGIQPVKRQLGERAAAQFVIEKGVQKRLMGANTRVYTIDLTSMRETIDE
jgi:hypothetical protein